MNSPVDYSRLKPSEIDIMPDAAILVQARMMAGEPSLSLRNLANLMMHDPISSLAFLHSSNSVVYGGTSSVTSVEAALSRLGLSKITDTLNQLHERPDPASERIAEVLEVLRYNCRRTSIVSLILSTVLLPRMSEMARLTGLLADVGHMVALLKLGEEYCDIAEEHGRAKMVYRLQKDHKIDLKALRLDYLAQKGVPSMMLTAYDEEAQRKSGGDVKFPLIIMSAIELIEAMDAGKFEKYGPKEELPTRSSLRLLGVGAADQKKIFETCLAYLKQVQEDEAPEGAGMLLTSLHEDGAESEEEEFDVDKVKIPTYPAPQIKAKSRNMLQPVFDLCESERDENSLQEKCVAALVDSGLFARSVIVRVDSDSNDGIVEHCKGFDFEAGHRFSIEDPLSPFNLFRVQIKSTKTDQVGATAPFGVSAYAIGPVGLTDKEEKIVLYADASGESSLSMEMRKIFRFILELLEKTIESIRAHAESSGDTENSGGSKESASTNNTPTESVEAAPPPPPPGKKG